MFRGISQALRQTRQGCGLAQNLTPPPGVYRELGSLAQSNAAWKQCSLALHSTRHLLQHHTLLPSQALHALKPQVPSSSCPGGAAPAALLRSLRTYFSAARNPLSHSQAAKTLKSPPFTRPLCLIPKRTPATKSAANLASPVSVLRASQASARGPIRGVVTGAHLAPAPTPEVLSKARKMGFPVGIGAGLFGSFVGVGGGVIIVPVIVNACRTIPQRMVSGTSLAAVVSTAGAASYTYLSHGAVDPSAAAIIAGAAMLTAPLGANLTVRMNCQALRRALGYFLLFVAPLVPLKSMLFSSGDKSEGQKAKQVPEPALASGPMADGAAVGAVAAMAPVEGTLAALWSRLEFQMPEPAQAALLVGMGGAVGLVSGLLGVGGGTVLTPLLAISTGMPQAMVLGTSLLAMIPPSLVALAQHQRLGNVDWRLAGLLGLGTLVGSLAGSTVAVKAPDGVLEIAFTVGMLFLGGKTLQAARPVAAALKKA